MSEISLEKYKEAYRNITMQKAKRGFKIHAIIYGIVNAGLITLNMLTLPQMPWFIYPLIGWGIGLASNYYFGVRKYPQRLENDEMEAESMARR
jgi:hypothetical protein